MLKHKTIMKYGFYATVMNLNSKFWIFGLCYLKYAKEIHMKYYSIFPRLIYNRGAYVGRTVVQDNERPSSCIQVQASLLESDYELQFFPYKLKKWSLWYGMVMWKSLETYLNKKPRGYLLRLWLKFVLTNTCSHWIMIIYIYF